MKNGVYLYLERHGPIWDWCMEIMYLTSEPFEEVTKWIDETVLDIYKDFIKTFDKILWRPLTS